MSTAPVMVKRSGSAENNQFTQVTASNEQISPVYVSANPYYDGQRRCHREERWFIGADIPDFHRRRKAGELLPHTPWTQYVFKGDIEGWMDFTYASAGTVRRQYCDGMLVPGSVGWITEADLDAASPPDFVRRALTQDAASKIYSQGYDLLTFVGELNETRKMFTEFIPKLFKEFKRANTLQELTNDYLELRYGWRTMVYDIMAINDAITHFNEATRVRSSERSGDFSTSTTVRQYVFETNSPAGNCLRTVTDEVEVWTRASVSADIAIPKLQINPLTTWWELTKLSFVVDWVLQVGTALNALSFLTLAKKWFASSGYRVEIERNETCEIHAPTSSFLSGVYGWKIHDEATKELREPCSVPILPQFTCRLNPMKVLDLQALMLQYLTLKNKRASRRR